VTVSACARCRRAFAAGEPRAVPKPVAAAIEIAFAFFHGGLWAEDYVKGPFCARCARNVTFLSALVGLSILTVAAFGVALWLHGPGR
jgi:hypothetical protein